MAIANDASGTKSASSMVPRGGVVQQTKSFPSNFPTLCADLVPSAVMQFIRAIPKLTSKGNDFSNNKLCNTSRICKRRVKNSNAMSCCIFKVDLVGSDTETAHHNQIPSFTEDLRAELRLRSYPNNVHIALKTSIS